MSDTCHSVRHSIVLAFVVLISLSLYVDDLLQGTLLKPAICVTSLSRIATVCHEIDVHLAIFTIEAIISDLLADIMVFSMTTDLYLEYLSVNDIRCLLFY